MLLTEYDEKKVMEYLKQEARDEGRAEGRAEGLAEGEAKGLAKGKTEGKTAAIIDLVKDGVITLEQGAARLNISIAQMNKMISVC